MRQQINLFQDELRERKAVLPGRQVVFALLAVSALCVLAALWMAQRAATPRDELLRVNAALAERQASVAELGERLEARQPDAALAEQARHLERRLQHLRRLVDIASRPAADAPLSTFVAGLGRQRQQRRLVPAGEQEGRGEHAQQPAMEGHAALPDHQDLQRIGEVIVRPVEQHIAKPPADHHAQRRPDHEIVQQARLEAHRLPPGQQQRIAPAADQPDDIGQRVPADDDGAKLQRDRVDGGECQQEQLLTAGSSDRDRRRRDSPAHSGTPPPPAR